MQHIVRPAFVVDLRKEPTASLVAKVFYARGQRRAAWLRTKINQVLEQRTGRRGRSNGRDRVLSNGGVKKATR